MLTSILILMACDEPAPDVPCTATSWYLDADGDGYGDPYSEVQSCVVFADSVDNHQDCNDLSAEENPDAIWYRDVDGDGYGDLEQAIQSCSQPVGHIVQAGDCDDLDSLKNPDSVWYSDLDVDGFGDQAQTIDSCGDLTNASPVAGDCDDQDWTINPDANEICDDIDNNCDGDIDDDDLAIDIFTQVPIFEDLDGDGYGSDVSLGRACPSTTLGSSLTGDCDDLNENTYPYRLDYLDSVDSDCDGETAMHIVSSTTTGWQGDNSSSAFGIMLRSKDIDGDDRPELLAGMYNADNYAGGAQLIPGNLVGNQSYFPEEGSTWTGETSETSLHVGDKAGYSIAFIGDWNGDGVEDISIGAPYSLDVTGTHPNTGVAYIISSDMPSGSLSDALHIVRNESTGNYFGHTLLGVGDLNADGLDDVMISARLDEAGSCSDVVFTDQVTCEGSGEAWSNVGNNQGAIYIAYGGDTDNSTLASADALFGESNGDQFSYSMDLVGDADGDGINDYVIGAPYSDRIPTSSPRLRVGCAYLLSQNDLTGSSIESLPRFYGPQTAMHAGLAVSSAGDFDGDGLDDMLISGSDYDVGWDDSILPTDTNGALDTSLVSEDEGAAYVVLGSNIGWSSDSLADAHLSMYGSTPDDRTGRYLYSIGDIDADMKGDIIVTAHNSDVYMNNAGMVYGVLGGASGTLYLATEADFQIVGEGTNDYLGKGSAKAGDLNDDGLDDFWLGANGATQYGTVYLLEGVGTPSQ